MGRDHFMTHKKDKDVTGASIACSGGFQGGYRAMGASPRKE